MKGEVEEEKDEKKLLISDEEQLDQEILAAENLTHLTFFSMETVNDGFPLHPFVWNTTG